MAHEEGKSVHDHKRWGGHRGHGGSSLAGVVWFIGWLFTIGFAQLVWWQIILGIVVWPYYLALAVR
jgi:hypothetical protein